MREGNQLNIYSLHQFITKYKHKYITNINPKEIQNPKNEVVKSKD